jgi:ribosomal 50S subunit-associated protein YjgA (DUF615 family)
MTAVLVLRVELVVKVTSHVCRQRRVQFMGTWRDEGVIEMRRRLAAGMW